MKDNSFLEMPNWGKKIKKREMKAMISFYLPVETIARIEEITSNKSEFIRYCIELGLKEYTQRQQQQQEQAKKE